MLFYGIIDLRLGPVHTKSIEFSYTHNTYADLDTMMMMTIMASDVRSTNMEIIAASAPAERLVGLGGG